MAQSRMWRVVLLSLCLAVPAAAQEGEGQEAEEQEQEEPEGLRPRLRFGLEAKAHFRDSDENRFLVPFDFDPEPGPDHVVPGFEETVNAGSHIEASIITLLVDADWGDGLAAHGKFVHRQEGGRG
jgi:hypothetical protein